MSIKGLSSLPAVEKLLQLPASGEMINVYGRPLTLSAVRTTLDGLRDRMKNDDETIIPDPEEILSEAKEKLASWTAPTLRSVVNATGVILHTNLGRAPLSKATIAAMNEVAAGYSNLEIDLETGKRGSRFVHAESILKALTGAEAAMVVNNNSAAVLLVLSALASKKRVLIARSQLVEIGGGFRVPDVMKQSGAKLVEIGTTNKVRVSDYEAELPGSTIIMRVHRSNFKMIGFTEEPELDKIVACGHQGGLIVVDDLGSGVLLDTAKFGLEHEPTVQESVRAGADVICFSGDKLLGGPQAGIIVGKKELLVKIIKHPLARAVRADKTCLAGITATLMHYLQNEAESKIPIWQMISSPAQVLRSRTEEWVRQLGTGTLCPGESTIGGGSLPGEVLTTYLLVLDVKSPDKFLRKLREQNPPVLARTENDRVLLDPRTVFPEQDTCVVDILQSLLAET